MSPSATVADAQPQGTDARAGIERTPRFAFTANAPAPTLDQVNGNVAAVLAFLARVVRDPERAVALDPIAADGLSTILDAAHHDLLEAAERAEAARRALRA